MKYIIKGRAFGFPQDTPEILGEYSWFLVAWFILNFWHNYEFHITWMEEGGDE